MKGKCNISRYKGPYEINMIPLFKCELYAFVIFKQNIILS